MKTKMGHQKRARRDEGCHGWGNAFPQHFTKTTFVGMNGGEDIENITIILHCEVARLTGINLAKSLLDQRDELFLALVRGLDVLDQVAELHVTVRGEQERLPRLR